MNDIEYIREAVKLADGWERKMLGYFKCPMSRNLPNGPKHKIAYGPGLDALAAQLVRQALANGFDFSIEIQGSHFEAPGCWIVIHDPIRSEQHRFESDAREDIAINKIRAIVDSKVLTNE